MNIHEEAKMRFISMADFSIYGENKAEAKARVEALLIETIEEGEDEEYLLYLAQDFIDEALADLIVICPDPLCHRMPLAHCQHQGMTEEQVLAAIEDNLPCPGGSQSVVLYTRIRPAEGQTFAQVIRKATRMGYTLVPFEGWTNADLGMPGNHGPHWEDARRNGQAARAIQDACELNGDWPQIFYTAADEA